MRSRRGLVGRLMCSRIRSRGGNTIGSGNLGLDELGLLEDWGRGDALWVGIIQARESGLKVVTVSLAAVRDLSSVASMRGCW